MLDLHRVGLPPAKEDVLPGGTALRGVTDRASDRFRQKEEPIARSCEAPCVGELDPGPMADAPDLFAGWKAAPRVGRIRSSCAHVRLRARSGAAASSHDRAAQHVHRLRAAPGDAAFELVDRFVGLPMEPAARPEGRDRRVDPFPGQNRGLALGAPSLLEPAMVGPWRRASGDVLKIYRCSHVLWCGQLATRQKCAVDVVVRFFFTGVTRI
jgi:hypothetical protein